MIGILSALQFCSAADSAVTQVPREWGAKSKEEWEKVKRPETLKWFLENEYGVRPKVVNDAKAEYECVERLELDGGEVIKRKIRVKYEGKYGKNYFDVTVFQPRGKENLPLMVLLCNRPQVMKFSEDKVPEVDFWPVREILARGCATAAFMLSEISPETYNPETAHASGAVSCFERPEDRNETSWGTLSAWAWGASLFVDWIEDQREFDLARIGIVGHSRGGKAALVAGVLDKRFSLVCSNNSGCGGAKLNRMKLPESEYYKSFLHYKVTYWFCGRMAKVFPGCEEVVEHDQDEWLALVAPRKLCVASATEDLWAGPAGEKAAAESASRIWKLYGREDKVKYHVRKGKHDLTPFDWKHYLDALLDTDANDWENMSVNSRSRLPARTYSVPLQSEEDALSDKLDVDSPYRMSLNGTWKLSWAGDPKLRVKGFEAEDFDDSDWFTIPVPACVELHGFGSPGYVNWRYPHKLDWPRIRDRQSGKDDYNPVSSYRRKFTLPANWKERRVILRFDGVYSAYYVWVNGRKVGYAEDSKLPSEFDVTDFVKEGENTLAVEVYRWCDGSYLEDQDMTRYSGIFRDVTLWSMPKDGIWDFTVKTIPVDGYENWILELELENGDSASLYDAQNKKVADLSKLSDSRFQLHLKPHLWSAEKPYLYTLVVRKGVDIRMRRVGFKDQKIIGNAIYVNGRKIKFRGVNRHETSPVYGRSVTLDEMIRDIELMKRYNFDTVRTSHYPNHRLWYDLCDRYGLYVMAEANVEGHEPMYGKHGLGRFNEWRHSIVERNERNVLFYRNHPSVVFWSLGNETGHGPCFTAAMAAVKEIDNTRIVQWEPWNNESDVDARMYRSIAWLEQRGRLGAGLPLLSEKELGEKIQLNDYKGNQSANKPFFMCEYAHAMGNALGNFEEYWQLFYKYDSLTGGCIWDWVDQAIWKETNRVDPSTGKRERYLAFGGDFDEAPNDGPFNCNGLITAERKVTPKLIEAAHVQRYLSVDSSFTLHNRYAFTQADEFSGDWELIVDGKSVKKGVFDVPAVKPLSSAKLPFAAEDFAGEGERFLNISFALKNDTLWAKKGWVVARNQIAISSEAVKNGFAAKPQDIKVEETSCEVAVVSGRTRVVFDRATGAVKSLTMNDRAILRAPAEGVLPGPVVTCQRAFVDNDVWLCGHQHMTPMYYGSFPASGLTQLRYHARPIKIENGTVVVTTEITGSKSAGFTHEARWTFMEDGSLEMKNRLVPHGTMPIALPRLGLSMILDKSLENMRWYGRGPHENYVDRFTSAFFGLWDSTVSEQYVDYVRPQDNGFKSDVRWVEFRDQDGSGVRFSSDNPMFVQALHYQMEDIQFSRHRAEQARRRIPLVKRPEIYLNLDLRQLGLGGNSCGPKPLEKYIFPIKEENWTVRMDPVVK